MFHKTYPSLLEAGIFPHGSDELVTFEQRLARYFLREYRRHRDQKHPSIVLDCGPLALAPEKLAGEHYDEGLEFFRTFLDHETMSYTMALFDENPDRALASSISLAEAQTRKFRLITDRMEISGDERILDIGCGFGYFDAYLLTKYPELQIAATTQSRDQYRFLMQRTRDPRDPLSSPRFKLFFGNIDTTSPAHWGRAQYQLVFSIGLLEQINNIALMFRIIGEMLADGGRMFHHLIVSRDLIPNFLDPDKTLIGNYFPGGKVLPFYALQFDSDVFTLEESWFINGLNYWKTLDQWHANFWKNLHLVYPAGLDTERVRYWNDYFVLCKAMFWPDNGAAYGNGQYLYRKK